VARAVLTTAIALLSCWCLQGRAWAIAAVYIPPWTAADRARLERQADSGNPDAQLGLADCLHDGACGYAINRRLATHWYLKAAQQGQPRAQATIGQMYEFGEGVPQDHSLALEWIRKATKSWPQSAIGVAYRYEHGVDTAVNLAKAMEWYRISAEAGYVIAQTSLGELYENAPGLQNFGEAARWYRAAAATWTPAMCDLGRLYDAGKGVAQDHREAAQWYRQAMDKSDIGCAYDLGLLYEQGLGVAKDNNKAMELYHRAASGNPDAQRRLFSLYEAGLGLPADPEAAIAWYRTRAEQGDRRAEVGLGLHYQFGKGVAINMYVAYALYLLAEQQRQGLDDLPQFVGPQDAGFERTGVTTHRLVKEMSQPGTLLKAIQYFLDHPPPEQITD
jgi:uncharacterized protein